VKRPFYIFFLLLIIVVSCEKPPEYSFTPEINFLSISNISVGTGAIVKEDSVTIGITFTDGDGDLGVTQDMVDDNSKFWTDTFYVEADTIVLDEGDTIFIEEDVIYEHSNFYAIAYKKVDGEFELLDETEDFKGRFDPMIDEDKSGPIDGTLYCGFSVVEDLSDDPTVAPGDTLKFEIYIYDRELNQSNMVETSEIVLFVD
jgi:hypothetical protein